MVIRSSFNALSITLDNKEDHIKALMTFSSFPTSPATSYVSTPPQHIKYKCQTCKMLHSKPKLSSPICKQPSSTAGTRSSHSSLEKQLSPMATANGMVINSYHQKNYGRNCCSSKVSTTLSFHAIVANCLGLPPHAPHIFHVHLCDDLRIVSQHPHETALCIP